MSDFYWMDRKLEDLSKEELIEVVAYYAKIGEDRFKPENIRAHALGRVELIKRGEA